MGMEPKSRLEKLVREKAFMEGLRLVLEVTEHERLCCRYFMGGKWFPPRYERTDDSLGWMSIYTVGIPWMHNGVLTNTFKNRTCKCVVSEC